MSIKVKDLAAMLNLSPSTVSLVLNNKPGISEATRSKVIDTVKDLGYGDILITEEESRNILFVVYRKHGIALASTPYFSQLFSEIIEGVEKQVKARGFNLMIFYVDEENIREQAIGIGKEDIAGVILLATEMQEQHIESFQKMKLPLVILDNYLPQAQADCITINNELGVYEAVRHLAEYGHTRIGYLHVVQNANNFQERYFGFIRAMLLGGLTIRQEDIIEIDTDGVEAVSRQLKSLLSDKKVLPSAYFADNDIVAICAMKVFRELGYRIPEDISIIGFDNMTLSEMLDPPLTTIQIPKHNLGVIAVNTLIDKINEVTAMPMKIEVATELIVRQSVKMLTSNKKEN